MDDTSRLVYADWLDEHGAAQTVEYLRQFDHAKAEYLRLIVQPDPTIGCVRRRSWNGAPRRIAAYAVERARGQ